MLKTGAPDPMRVRRSNDNALAVIPWKLYAPRADAYWVDEDALLAHCGANSGFVETLYDQTGNAKHLTIATASFQPRIVNAGVIERVNGLPSIRYRHSGGVNVLRGTGGLFYNNPGLTVFAVVQAQPTQTFTASVVGEYNGSNRYRPIFRGTTAVANALMEVVIGTAQVNSLTLATNAFDGTPRIVANRDTTTNFEGFRDGVRDANTAYTRSGTAFSPTNFEIGAEYNGHMSEVIAFGTALPDADLNVIIASQGRAYGISTVPFEAPPPPPTAEELEFAGRTFDGSFAEFNTNWQGYTATFENLPQGLPLGLVGVPIVFRRQFKPTSGAANRINVSVQSSLNGFDTFALPIYQGATARVYRVTNGVMDVVRESTVTGGKIGSWNWLRPDGNKVVDALSYTHALESWVRPGVPYYFRVAAVGSNGLAGTWSAPVSLTPANVTGTPSGTVNPTKAFNKTGEGGALPAPGSVAVTSGVIAREAVVTWAAVAGAEGYVVEQSFYDPAEIEAVPYLDLAIHAVPILADDLVIVSKEYLTQDDSLFCNRVFDAAPGVTSAETMIFGRSQLMKRDGNSWEYMLYSGDRPSGASGNHFIRRTAAAGNTTKFEYYWHAGTDQTYYKVLEAGKTYRLRVIMRASEARTVTFRPGGPTLSNTTFSVGTTFAEYTYDMTPASTLTATTPYPWQLEFSAGAVPVNLDVALFDIQEVGISANPLASSPPAANSFLRDHRFIKPGSNGRNMADILVTGFKTFHDACVLNSCKPWLQFEWHTPKQDILNLVAFLAAPNTESHPMVTLRQSMGITAPWVDTFDEIKFENANEAWNPLAFFWVTPSMTDSATATAYSNGNVAGLLWQMTSRWMQESPYWSALAPKLVQHAGGWAINTFGEDAYRYFPDAKEVSIAAYNGGWDNGTALVSESGVSFNGLLADPIINQKTRATARANALKALCISLGRTFGTDVRPTIYEAGPGYQLNGLNNAAVTPAQVIAQEVVMKSRASGAATVDSMLTFAQSEFKGFNFFLTRVGDYWSSHGEVTNGNQEYIPHALIRIIHEEMAPARVYGSPTSILGTKDVTLQGGGSATLNQIGAYQLRSLANPSKRMIVLINRNLDPSQLPVGDPLYSATPSGAKLFSVQTTWNSATSLKAYTAGIGPYRQHNRYPVGQRRVAGGGLTADPLCVAFNYAPTTLSVPANIKNFQIDASVGATANGLPAGNVLILVFEGVT